MKNFNLDIPECQDCTNKNSVFCCLSYTDKETLSTNKGKNLFKKGQVIFYEGNYPHGLFCIYNGKVKITKLGDEGKEQVVRFAGSGDMLGYRSVLSNDPYQATATAMEDSLICHLSKDQFNKVLSDNNKLSLEIIKLLSTDLKKSEQGIINISQKPVKERVAETILLLKEQFGFESDEKTLDVRLTRREIGDIAGTTTETTIRTLSTLNKEGIITLDGKKIKINNLKSLIYAANVED